METIPVRQSGEGELRWQKRHEAGHPPIWAGQRGL